MEVNKPPHLSRAILEMKFMKKSKERVDKETESADGQAMYANVITEEMRKSGQTAYVYVGISHCKNLLEGRLSFGGMNPDIEKIMCQSSHGEQADALEKQKETEVSDKEMAKGYSTLVNTMGSKFNNSGKKPRKRGNFVKPAH